MFKDDQDNIQVKELTLRQQDTQKCEHTCQSEQDNHGKSKFNMLKQVRESINIISMSMSQMDIAINQMKSPHQTLNVLRTLKHRKAQGEGIHQMTNQMPHLPQLKFKFDLLRSPVVSCSTPLSY